MPNDCCFICRLFTVSQNPIPFSQSTFLHVITFSHSWFTVGATWGPFGQAVYQDSDGSYLMTVTGFALDLNVFKVLNSGFGTDFKKLTTVLPAVAAVPQDACAALTNAAAVKGKVVLVDRGTCLFSVKVGLKVPEI